MKLLLWKYMFWNIKDSFYWLIHIELKVKSSDIDNYALLPEAAKQIDLHMI